MRRIGTFLDMQSAEQTSSKNGPVDLARKDMLTMRKLFILLCGTFLCLSALAGSLYAGVPTPGQYDIFIEAEDAVGSSGFEVVGPPRAAGYSGGKMLSLSNPSEPGEEGYFAKYAVNVRKEGDYYVIVWAQGLDTPYSSPFHVIIDQLDLYFHKATAKIISPASRYGEDIVAHVVGPVRLKEGKHSLLIKVDERRQYRDRAFNLVVDALALSREIPGLSSVRQKAAALTVDCTAPSGSFSPMTDVSQGGIREVTDDRFWAPLAPLLKAIGTRNVRIDHIFDDDYYGVVHRNEAGTLTYHWDKLDSVLTQIIASGARPYFCLSYMPGAIAKGANAYMPPRDYRDWKAVCTELVEHVRRRFNLTGLYYEVWNEPDLKQFWGGSEEVYSLLYKASAEAIATADPNAKVGGPGVSNPDTGWMQTFLQYVKREGLRLDFVSWHLYNPAPQIYVKQIRYVNRILTTSGLPTKTETIISEWNFNAEIHPDNDAFYNAGHAAAVLKIFHELGLSNSLFFAPKDSSAPGEFHGEWGMVTSADRPKPVYYLFHAYARLKGRNVRVVNTDYAVKAFAVLDKDALRMLIWNYDEGSIFGVPRDVKLRVNLSGTALSHKNVQETAQRIDSKSMDQPPALTKSDPADMASSTVSAEDYFETTVEIQNGAALYIELKESDGGTTK